MSLTLEKLREVWNKEFLPNIRSEIRNEFDSLNATFCQRSQLKPKIRWARKSAELYFNEIWFCDGSNTSFEEAKPKCRKPDSYDWGKRISALNSSGYDVEVKLDELEQYGRRDCLEITGIRIVPDDNPVLLVQEMSAIMGVDLDKNDISTAHRLPPTKKVKDRLIVKFTRRDKREEIYSKRKLLKSKRTKDLHLSPVSRNPGLWAIKPRYMSTKA